MDITIQNEYIENPQHDIPEKRQKSSDAESSTSGLLSTFGLLLLKEISDERLYKLILDLVNERTVNNSERIQEIISLLFTKEKLLRVPAPTTIVNLLIQALGTRGLFDKWTQGAANFAKRFAPRPPPPTLWSSVRAKFQYYDSVRLNPFLSAEAKTQFVHKFELTQRLYHCLTRFGQRCRHKYTPTRIAHDLYMNPIMESQEQVIALIQHKAKYLFTITDLANIMETSLTNSCHFFAEPLAIKNPYNNIPFTKASLYNIYFFMKRRLMVLSPIIHAFFLANFNLRQFRDDNEVMIRMYTIEARLKTMSASERYAHVLKMIATRNAKYKPAFHIVVHSRFPRDILNDIMRPYLRLYYISTYSLDMNARYAANYELELALHKFHRFNPMFGRVVAGSRRTTGTATYNMRFCPFRDTVKYEEDHETSHLEISYSDRVEYQIPDEERIVPSRRFQPDLSDTDSTYDDEEDNEDYDNFDP